MKVTFLGVGEAVDENYGNTSILIEGDKNILLDCGFTVPPALWKYNSDPNFLDAICISHQHADHSFGVTPVLLRMWEDKRTKPLALFGQNIEALVKAQFDFGYKGFMNKITYPLNFLNINADSKACVGAMKLEFSRTTHSVENLAVRVSSKDTSVCYTGDGRITEDTEKLFSSASLVIVETKFIDKNVDGHSAVVSTLKLASKNKINRLAMVHLDRHARKEKERILTIIKEYHVNAFVPEPGNSITL